MDYQSLGAGIGQGVTGIITSLYAANNAGKTRKKMERYLDQQDTENQAWYNKDAYSDYTQRADTQNLMRQLRNTLDRQNQISSNTAVVTGATPEAQAAQKEQSNRVISDTYSNIGSMGQQYKDTITNRYLSMRNNYANQRMGMMEGTAQNYEQLLNAGLNTFGDSFKTSAGSGMIGGMEGGK